MAALQQKECGKYTDLEDRKQALGQSADGNLSFHPSQRHSRAGVDASAKGEVPVRMPPDVETVRFGELNRIAVGGPDAKPARSRPALRD